MPTPSESDTHVTATFYAQVEPIWPYAATEDSAPVGAKVVRIAQKRPDKPVSGTTLVKLSIQVPKSRFMPLCPEAVVVIPENMAEIQPVHVEALDPHEENDA